MKFPYSPPLMPTTPINEKLMLFYSFPDYSGNALALYEYVCKSTKFDTVWAIKDENTSKALLAKGVPCFWIFDRDEGNRWFSQAKYVVTTHEYDSAYPKYDGQVYVALGHSLILGWDQFGNVNWDQDALRYGKWKTTMADLCFVTSGLTRLLDASSFFYDARKAIITGEPRCDLLFHVNGRNNLKKIYPDWILQYQKIIMYVPSAQGSFGFNVGDGYKENIFSLGEFNKEQFALCLEAENACLLIRLHPSDEARLSIAPEMLPKHCRLLDSASLTEHEISLYHILNGIDVLIGDVSSLTQEFLLLDRPIVRTFQNIQEYQAAYNPGFGNVDFWYPGDRVTNQNELETAIASALREPAKNKDARAVVRKLLFDHIDGNSSARVLQAMLTYKPLENIESEMYTDELNKQINICKEELYQILKEKQALSETLKNTETKAYDTVQELTTIERALANTQEQLYTTEKLLRETEDDLFCAETKLLASEDQIIRLAVRVEEARQQMPVYEEVLIDYEKQLFDSENFIREMDQLLFNATVSLEESDICLQKEKQNNNELLRYLQSKNEANQALTAQIHERLQEIENFRVAYPYLRSYKVMNAAMRRFRKIVPSGSFLSRVGGKVLRFAWHLVKRRPPKVKPTRKKRILETQSAATIIERNTILYPLAFPLCEHPKVTIVIPVYNQVSYTYHCLKSLIDTIHDIEYEVILGDDCSTDETKYLAQSIKGLKVVHNCENLRFLRNCNNAAKEAKGKYIVFLNNDTIVKENWLKALVDTLDANPDAGMVGSKILYADGRLQEAGGIMWRDGSAWNYGNGQDPQKPAFNYLKEVDFISGCSIIIRATLWNEIGGFDERFAPAYYEDSDLAFEVRRHGYKVFYQPFSEVIHYEGISNGTDLSTGQKKYQVVNRETFVEKWKMVLDAEQEENACHVFTARERSRNKNTILFIDHYVPTFDKDAGSRTIYQYLQTLVDMDYNIKFIGDNFAPMQPYTALLQQMGIEVLYGVEMMNCWEQWLIDNRSYISVAFLNRPHISIKYIDAVRCIVNCKIIYNVCDLASLRCLREYQTKQDPKYLEEAKVGGAMETYCMKQADVVYTLSTDEQILINTQLGIKKAKICPIFIYRDYPLLNDKNPKKDLVFVGGFSHAPNEDGVRWFLNDIFPLISKKLPEVRINIVGSNTPDSLKAMGSERIRFLGFLSDEELVQTYQNARIAVIPLRYGAGVKGKTIEAMYHGLAVVSTSIGIEGLEGINEYIQATDSADAFASRVVELYQDENTIRKAGRRNQEFVKEHFGYDHAKAQFMIDFDSE